MFFYIDLSFGVYTVSQNCTLFVSAISRMSIDLYNFWHINTLINFEQSNVCTARHAYCVFLHYLRQEKLSNLHVFNNWYWF